MAYYVTTDGVDQTIDAPGFLFPSTGIIRIAVDRELFTGGGGIQITTPSSGSIIFYAPASNYFQISFTGTSQFMFGAAGYSFARGEQAIELDFDLGVIRCYGGASSALLGTFTATSVLSSLGGTTSTSLTWGKRVNDYSQSDVYAFQILENAVLVRDYDPSLSNGTGLVVPDGQGGTSASLINYNPPNDDSQWVFYGSGAAIIAPTTIASAEAFGTSVITTGVVLIAPTVIPTEEIVGDPTITSGGIIIIPAVITSEELLGSPTVVPLGVVLQPTVIVTEEVVGSPVLVTGIVIVLPTGIPSEEAVGEPFVDLILKQIFPTEILSLEDVGRPIVLGGDSIIIPIPNRQTWNAVAKYLRELVFTGYDNDVIMKWLRSEGYEDAYNDNWDDYLLGQGYLTGALSDRYSQWRQGVAGDDPWILSEGSWNDIKIWRDNENWRDS
jgi:hypothetical protein